MHIVFKKTSRVISDVKSRFKKVRMKFGVKVPNNFYDDIKFEHDNGAI